MIYPTINDLSKGEYNRYEIALATAKCARMITNEYAHQREEAESAAAAKETDKPVNALIDKEVRDEKAVKIAIGRIYAGKYRIVHKDPAEQGTDDNIEFFIIGDQCMRETDIALLLFGDILRVGKVGCAHRGDGVECCTSRIVDLEMPDRCLCGFFILNGNVLNVGSECRFDCGCIFGIGGDQLGERTVQCGVRERTLFVLTHDKTDGAAVSFKQFFHAGEIVNTVFL